MIFIAAIVKTMIAATGNSQSTNDYKDFSGIKITAYILNEVVQRFNALEIGESINIKVDNYEAIENDLNAWSRISGNRLEIIESDVKSKLIQLEKANDPVSNKKFAIIISNKGLEKLLSPLGFAWGAVVSGMEVHMYFQGPAVKVLEKGFKGRLKGFSSIFSGFARKGMSKIGHIPPQDNLMELKKLGAQFYICQPSMNHFKVKKSDLIFSDITVAEYVTFLEVLSDSDIKFFVQ